MKTKSSLSITPSEFRKLHAGIAMRTDPYYIHLSNRILHVLMREKQIRDADLLITIAIRMAAYLEDVVSRIGLFAAYRRIGAKTTGRKLPFFELDGKDHDEDYLDDEINDADIRFILWYSVQEAINEGKDNIRFLNPDNELIFGVGGQIADILHKDYETAPENTELYEFVHGVDFGDFMPVRNLLQWIYYGTYLSMNYPQKTFQKDIEVLRSRSKKWNEGMFNALSYEIDVLNVFRKTCTPLAVSALELLKEMTAAPGAAEKLNSMKVRNMSSYRILELNDDIVRVSAKYDSGKVLDIDRKSFEINHKLEPDMSILGVLVFFDGLWQLNGFAILTPAHENRDADEQNGDEGILRLNEFIAQRLEEMDRAYSALMKHSGNNQLIMFKNFNDYAEFWTRVFPDARIPDYMNDNYYRNATDIVLFADRKRGLQIVPDAARWIKQPDNTLYNEEDATKYAASIILGGTNMSLPLISYLLENDLIPDATLKIPEARQLIRENRWFLVRFFQPDLFGLQPSFE
ncbi:MAG: DUF3843 family protein [Prevotellaceae bacterium]|jgi:hypothetical protein|nr:DUF3843 family protein [Prevotellaceae bacterium]